MDVFLAAGGLDPFHQLVVVEVFVEGDLHGLIEPGGQVHGVGKGQTVDALSSVGDQGGTVEDPAGKGVQDADVLLGFSVGLHLGEGARGAAEGSFTFMGEHSFKHVVLPHIELAIFADQLAAVEVDLKAVGAGNVAGGGDEAAGGAICVFHIGGHIILHFDVMPLAVLQVGVD